METKEFVLLGFSAIVMLLGRVLASSSDLSTAIDLHDFQNAHNTAEIRREED